MKKHIAEIVPDSVRPLGAKGISFEVYCCGDHSTIERHTIMHSHTLTQEELQSIIERQYLKPHAEAHAANEINAEHVKVMCGKKLSKDCGCS